ncbi:hypothetical protein J7E25_05835 [Agromyces sp. ISL-38]|nr:hypothetical protein [Agromyces sp. ISL-38]
MPKFDFSALTPAVDVASLIPKIDTGALTAIANVQSMLPKMEMLVPSLNIAAAMPKFDYASLMPRTAAAEVLRAQESLLAGLPDYSKMLGGIRTDWLAAIRPQVDLTATLQPIFEMLRSFDWDSITKPLRVPDNWPDDIHDNLPELLEMVNRDGIPAAWVPRSEVLTPLLAASAGDERSEVLIKHRDEILDDCSAWLDDLSDPVLDAVLPIAREVLDACRNGFWKVGAISAVQVVHSIVESLHWVSDRQRVAKHHVLTMETPYARMLEQATRAPLVLFYDDWNPLSGKPRPAHLTRHVVSHRLGEDQVNERNCIVAVMLMASLLVTVYQLDLGQKEIAA